MSHINIHTCSRYHACQAERLAAWDVYVKTMNILRAAHDEYDEEENAAYLREAAKAEKALHTRYDAIDAEYL